MSDIKMLKLINGEEVLGKVTAYDGGWSVKKPMVLGMMPVPNGQPQLGLGEYLPLGDDDEITFSDDHVMFVYTPKKQIVSAYQATVSNLALPQTTGIIKP